MVNVLLAVTFACGVFIAVAHVVNRRFVAPVYDVVANLAAFGCAVAASSLLGHPVPATLSAVAFACWIALGRRTMLARRRGAPTQGMATLGEAADPADDGSARAGSGPLLPSATADDL